MLRLSPFTVRTAVFSALLSASLAAQGSFVTTTGGAPGTGGAIPVLSGSGDVLAGISGSQLEVANALPGAAALMVIGFSEAPTQLFGMTIGPSIDVVLATPNIDNAGEMIFPLSIPANTPAGTQYWAQCLVLDAGAANGLASATNALRITTDEFEFFPNFQDPNPPGYHPLRQGNTPLLQFDEVLTLFNSGSVLDPSDTTPGHLYSREDSVHGSRVIQAESGGEADFIAVQSGAGDVDGDGDEDAVFIGRMRSTNIPAIRAVSPDANGAYDMSSAITSQTIDAATGVHGAVGDVDGDGVDDVVTITTTAISLSQLTVWQYSDQNSTFVPSLARLIPSTFGRVVLGQFDDDDALEVVVITTLTGPIRLLVVQVLDDMNADFQSLGSRPIVVPGPGTLHSAELVVGNYDDDPEQEFSIAMQLNFGRKNGGTHPSHYCAHEFHSFLDALDLTNFTRWRTPDPITSGTYASNGSLLWEAKPQTRRDHVVAARFGTRVHDRICWLAKERARLGWIFRVTEINPLDPTDVNFYRIDPNGSQRMGGYADLIVMDDRGAGEDRILIALGGFQEISGSWFGDLPRYWLMQSNDSRQGQITLTRLGPQPTAEHSSNRTPIMVAGDFDREGVRLRFTGDVRPAVANPIPLVVMAAPPTDDRATTQNRIATGSGFIQGFGRSSSHTVSNSTSLSLSAGVSFDDLFGVFDVGAMQSVEDEVASSTGATRTVATFAGHYGAWDADSILFQGTMYLSYAYEAIGGHNAAVADGSIIRINVPVEYALYQLELESYNAIVEPRERILPADVFTHRVGDPSTYRSRSLARDVRQLPEVSSFYETGPNTVAQGGGSNKLAIEISSVITTGESLRYSVDDGANFSLGGLTVGQTEAIGSETLYEVAVERTTEFEGVVGAIDSFSEWQAYGYSYGLFTYIRAGRKPYQVLDFWTAAGLGGR